jgi:thiamine biosynthesis lipoprotein
MTDLFAAGAQRQGFASASWDALGTTARLVVVDPRALAEARHRVERCVAEIDASVSRFRDDSELARVNSARGGWCDVSPLFARALRVALDAAVWTFGLVDPTMGAALVDLGYDRTFRLVPSDGPAVTVRARPAPGWHTVELDERSGRVRVPAGTLLDLGATAKGLASDLAAAAAAQATGCGVLVSLGGDLAVAGSAPAEGWPVLVEDIHDRGAVDGSSELVAVRGGGLATSSTRARRWRRGGDELHHLLDPRSGAPTAGPWRTVSVAAETCVLANAASTAAIVMGAGAPGWFERVHLAARLVGVDGGVTRTSGWSDVAARQHAEVAAR